MGSWKFWIVCEMLLNADVTGKLIEISFTEIYGTLTPVKHVSHWISKIHIHIIEIKHIDFLISWKWGSIATLRKIVIVFFRVMCCTFFIAYKILTRPGISQSGYM